MKDCPTHPDGHLCPIEVPHVLHVARVYDGPDDRIGRNVGWREPDAVVPPSGRAYGTFSNSELAEMATAVEGNRADVVRQLNDPSELLSRVNAPSTSKAAASGLRTGTDKLVMLEQYVMAGDNGCTDEEAAVRSGLYDIDGNMWWARSNGLRKQGLILKDGDRVRPGKSGADRMVCVVTAKGVTLFNQSTRKG